MSPNAQRAVIAEACGWTMKPFQSRHGAQKPMWHNPDGTPMGFTPDYLKDLNAAIELTNILAKEGWRSYFNNGLDATWEVVISTRNEPLERSCLIPTEDDFYGAANTLAGAICEAFLQKLGKWKENA